MLDNVDQMNEQSLPHGDLESLRCAKAGRKEGTLWSGDSNKPPSCVWYCRAFSPLHGFLAHDSLRLYSWFPSLLSLGPCALLNELCFYYPSLCWFPQTQSEIVFASPCLDKVCMAPFAPPTQSYCHTSQDSRPWQWVFFQQQRGCPSPTTMNTPSWVRASHVGSKYSSLCQWWSVRLILFGTEASVPLLWMKWISSRLP